jgi:hypothetical protein
VTTIKRLVSTDRPLPDGLDDETTAVVALICEQDGALR